MHPYLLKALALGPSSIYCLMMRIPVSDYDTVFEDDRFTVREVVAHLADWEPLFRTRMELALAKSNPEIFVYDEGDRAIDQKYSELDIEEQFAHYATERKKTLAFLTSLTPSDYRRPYIHPANGQMVIEDQANMLIGHDLYHVEQLIGYLDKAVPVTGPRS